MRVKELSGGVERRVDRYMVPGYDADDGIVGKTYILLRLLLEMDKHNCANGEGKGTREGKL